MPRSHRGIAALTCGVVLVTCLGACTAAPPQPSARPLPAAVQPDTRPEAGPMLAGVLDRIRGRASASYTIEGSLGALGDLDGEGSLSYSRRTSDLGMHGQVNLTKTRQRNQVEIAIVDDIGYVRSPLLHTDPGKPWLRVEPGAPDPASQLLGPALDQIRAAVDPVAAFGGIEPATKIQSTAAEHIDGIPTTRYDLRVLTGPGADLTSDPRQRGRLERAARGSEPELDYRLWLDPAGLPVKFTATRQLDQAGEVSMTARYQDWGSPVEIQRPAPERIGDAPR